MDKLVAHNPHSYHNEDIIENEQAEEHYQHMNGKGTEQCFAGDVYVSLFGEVFRKIVPCDDQATRPLSFLVFKYGKHITGDGSGHAYPFARYGMNEGHLSAVEGLSSDKAQASAVEVIACKGMADI